MKTHEEYVRKPGTKRLLTIGAAEKEANFFLPRWPTCKF